jgi:ADP-L-glycero-D-manno-heptose 6-epimerase
MMMKQDTSGIFNVGTGTARNLAEIAKVIADKYDAKIEYIDMPDKLKGQYQEYTCADNTKLHNTIPVRRWMTIEDYLNGAN